MQSKPSSPPEGSTPPPTTTSSTSAVETLEGTHVFHVCGYKLLRGIGPGRFVRSGTFAVGGYRWSLRFFPGGGDGQGTSSSSQDCCFRADLMNKNAADVKAFFTIGLVNQADGSTRWEPTTPLMALSTAAGSTSARIAVRRSKVEDFAVLRGDRVSIVCVVGVVRIPRVLPAVPVPRAQVPPPDLPECLGRLLEEGVGADVNIHVADETFAAHRIVLAMRSPVFKAQLFGPMREKTEEVLHLTIDDMQPAIFTTLLRFMYTDSLPVIGGRDEDDRREMVCHLLVAADRYAMERLKIMCQGILHKALAVHTVAAMLALADQHHCSVLKDACMEFIFSPNRLGDVVESHGFAKLKTTCPSVLVEIFEKSSEFCKI